MPFEMPKPEHPYSGETFTFMGWEFADHHGTSQTTGEAWAHLLSWHILHNPDSPDAIYAYKGYKFGEDDRPLGRKYAAAWLISHWFEHYMGACPCLHGDGPSNFRDAFMETLLA